MKNIEWFIVPDSYKDLSRLPMVSKMLSFRQSDGNRAGDD